MEGDQVTEADPALARSYGHRADFYRNLTFAFSGSSIAFFTAGLLNKKNGRN